MTEETKEVVEMERFTVEYLRDNYTKEQLMKVFKYQNINKTPVLGAKDLEMILALPDDHPDLTRETDEEDE